MNLFMSGPPVETAIHVPRRLGSTQNRFHTTRRSTNSFSLIVCTIGRQDELKRLLESLENQTYKSFEVVLVDQNPPGFLEPIIRPFESRLTIHPLRSAPGLSLARNVGLRHSRGEFVCFPDDDCWYQPRTLENAAQLFHKFPEKVVIAGRTLDRQGAPSVSDFLPDEARVTEKNFLRCGNSNTLFCRRHLFDMIGTFDPRLGVGAPTPFQSGEESDIILRAIEKGLDLRFFPGLTVHHDQVSTAGTDAARHRARCYGAGFGALLRKHHFPLSHVGYRVLRPLAGAAMSAAAFDGQVAHRRLEWTKGIVTGYVLWPKVSRRGNSTYQDALD